MQLWDSFHNAYIYQIITLYTLYYSIIDYASIKLKTIRKQLILSIKFLV